MVIPNLTPTEAGDAIAGAGVNVVLQATNHTADQGMSGISFHLDNCLKWSDEILGDWVLSADEVLSPESMIISSIKLQL